MKLFYTFRSNEETQKKTIYRYQSGQFRQFKEEPTYYIEKCKLKRKPGANGLGHSPKPGYSLLPAYYSTQQSSFDWKYTRNWQRKSEPLWNSEDKNETIRSTALPYNAVESTKRRKDKSKLVAVFGIEGKIAWLRTQWQQANPLGPSFRLGDKQTNSQNLRVTWTQLCSTGSALGSIENQTHTSVWVTRIISSDEANPLYTSAPLA